MTFISKHCSLVFPKPQGLNPGLGLQKYCQHYVTLNMYLLVFFITQIFKFYNKGGAVIENRNIFVTLAQKLHLVLHRNLVLKKNP